MYYGYSLRIRVHSMLLSMTCPRNLMLVCENKHLSALRVTPTVCKRESYEETSVVFLLGAPIDKNVVNVANNTIQSRQALGHSPLVQLGCAGDTKW